MGSGSWTIEDERKWLRVSQRALREAVARGDEGAAQKAREDVAFWQNSIRTTKW